MEPISKNTNIIDIESTNTMDVDMEDVITITTSDGQSFQVLRSAISKYSKTIQSALDATGDTNIVLEEHMFPLPRPQDFVPQSVTITKILQWVNYHHQNPTVVSDVQPNGEIKKLCEFDREFLNPGEEYTNQYYKPELDNLSAEEITDVMTKSIATCDYKKRNELFALINAVNYLEMDELMKLAAFSWAYYWVKGKTPVELRHIFEITRYWTEEEERQVKEDNEWPSSNEK
jgi:hypothetical protein